MNKTLNSLPRRQMLAGSASALAAAGLATFTRGAAAAGETPVASATPKPLPKAARLVSMVVLLCTMTLAGSFQFT